MNDTPLLDDFERSIVHTLHTKADQLDVDDDVFRPDAPPPLRLVAAGQAPPARGGRAAWRPRRLLAIAAALVLVVGGAAVLRNLRPGAGDDTISAADDMVWGVSPDEADVLGLSPAPEGWILTDVSAGQTFAEPPQTWQLFATDGVSPLRRGVLVASRPRNSEGLSGEPTHTVQDQPAYMGPSTHPYVPAGALEIEWADGDVFHQVVAVGLTKSELVDFLDALVPRAEAEAGFDPGPGADPALPALDAETSDDQITLSTVTYALPDGSGEVMITAESSPYGGGLLHRLVGDQRDGGAVIGDGNGENWAFVSVTRADGSVVDVNLYGASGPPAVGWLESIADLAVPMTQQQILEGAVTLPVTATATVDGRTIEVHGTETKSVALCVTPAGSATVCALASGGPEVTAGAAFVDGEWIMVVLSDATMDVTVQTSPSSRREHPEAFDAETLDGVVDETDGQIVELVTVPADVEAVMAMIPTGDDTYTGFGFETPTP